MGKDSVEIKLLKLKETKTTWCFESANGDAVKTLYLAKGALVPMPDAIRLVVEAVRSRDEAG